MKIDSYTKDIPAAATPVNMIATASGSLPTYRYARAVKVQCPSANTSDLTIGSKDRQATIVAKGTTMDLAEINRAGQSGKYDLAEMFVKAGTDGDDVIILLIDPSVD